MRLISFLLFAIFISQISLAQHSLIKLWETDTLLKVPESVLFDASNKVLYVSNIEGTEPWGKDGKGSIAKVGLDGKIIAAEWISGLNAPKGMGLHKGKLYVADMTNIVVVDLQKGAIEKTIPVEEAGGLNDISIGSDGVIWASDSRNKKLYKIENDKPTVYLENLKGPNGVLMRGKDLYVLDAGGMYAVKDDKTLTMVTDGMEGGTDGIENISGNDFLVSCWQGAIWYIDEKGEKQLLLDTKAEKKNTADIGFDPVTKTVYVPTFWRNSVVAYQLK
ncbi:SMP-30/gluconolactonase/LRE family protein [Terrimonas alba]|uniref:SMP-30/gluconolactonase/LRE family protein n=1 Tax=Terrimonas alba TaxID=3349636 RepID=UPI0035F302A7